MKPITKKHIQETLRTLDRTAIFKLAKAKGVNVANRVDVMNFIKDYAPTQKVYKAAYNIAFYKRCNYNTAIDNAYTPLTTIGDVIHHAKAQKNEGWSNYTKILIEGNAHIYWAHPLYKHQDYNKSIAFENTPNNRMLAEKINRYLEYIKIA